MDVGKWKENTIHIVKLLIIKIRIIVLSVIFENCAVTTNFLLDSNSPRQDLCFRHTCALGGTGLS